MGILNYAKKGYKKYKAHRAFESDVRAEKKKYYKLKKKALAKALGEAKAQAEYERKLKIIKSGKPSGFKGFIQDLSSSVRVPEQRHFKKKRKKKFKYPKGPNDDLPDFFGGL